MKKYNNIIVPTDGSVNSKRALEHTVVIASSLGAAITLVYVANIVMPSTNRKINRIKIIGTLP